MVVSTVLITGSSRGLGLEMVTQLSQRARTIKPQIILATCRDPDRATELQELAAKKPNLVVVKRLDVTRYDEFDRFFAEIEPYTHNDGLGMLVNNAGVSPGLTRLSTVRPDQMADTFNCNVIAPLMLTKAALPLLKRAGQMAEGKGTRKPLIINVSSILGSITNNRGTGGGIYPYRTSKAALNMLSRSLSLDLMGSSVCAMSVHPGWVKTDMGGKNAPLSKGESVAGILNLIENFQEDVHNGNFYDYEGNPVDW